jgi:hypothetical protein
MDRKRSINNHNGYKYTRKKRPSADSSCNLKIIFPLTSVIIINFIYFYFIRQPAELDFVFNLDFGDT